MPTITFKAKIETIYNMDETPAWRWVKVPKIERRHCDMNAFRSHSRFGSYANSDLFPNLLSRQFKELGIKQHIKLHEIPDCVTIDDSGFLATVTIEVK